MSECLDNEHDAVTLDKFVYPAKPPTLYFTDLPFEEALDPRVLEIFKRQQPHEQKSEGWLQDRKKCITASSIASAMLQTEEACRYWIDCFNLQDEFTPNPKKNCSYKDSQLDLIFSKCGLGDGFKGNEFTAWGNKYETIVQNIYAQMNSVDLIEFNLVFHPDISFLGASPDGITTKGVMLEIKCPPIRAVKHYPPLYYFQQILMQLECTNLDVCDYFDAHFVEFFDSEGWEEQARTWEAENLDTGLAKHHLYGMIMSYDQDGAFEKIHIYAPPNIVRVDQFLEWADKVEADLDDKGIEVIKTFYKLQEYYISTVHANKKWVSDNLPTIRDVWERIEYGRTPEGFEILNGLKNAKLEKKADRAAKKKSDEMASIFLELDVGGAPKAPPPKSRRSQYIHEGCLFD